MCLGVVTDLVAHARRQGEVAAVLQFGVQLSFQAKQDMALVAPVVGKVAGAVLDLSNPYLAKLASAPVCRTCFTWMRDRFYCRPVRGAKGD